MEVSAAYRRDRQNTLLQLQKSFDTATESKVLICSREAHIIVDRNEWPPCIDRVMEEQALVYNKIKFNTF
jgi:hypothetical protein